MYLLNLLLGSAKIAIWKTLKNKMLGIGSVDADKVFKGMAAAQIEYNYFNVVNNIQGFSDVWTVSEAFCEVGDDKLFILKSEIY